MDLFDLVFDFICLLALFLRVLHSAALLVMNHVPNSLDIGQDGCIVLLVFLLRRAVRKKQLLRLLATKLVLPCQLVILDAQVFPAHAIVVDGCNDLLARVALRKNCFGRLRQRCSLIDRLLATVDFNLNLLWYIRHLRSVLGTF